MSKYIQATGFRVKEGQLEAAQAELRRWVEGYRGIGCEASLYLRIGGGTSGDAMMSVEFPDGESWIKSLEDPRMMEARARMTEPDWPFEPASTSIWQELDVAD